MINVSRGLLVCLDDDFASLEGVFVFGDKWILPELDCVYGMSGPLRDEIVVLADFFDPEVGGSGELRHWNGCRVCFYDLVFGDLVDGDLGIAWGN